MCGITKKMKSLKHEKTTGSGERSLTFICFSAASKERCFSASSLRQQQLSRHRKKTKKPKNTGGNVPWKRRRMVTQGSWIIQRLLEALLHLTSLRTVLIISVALSPLWCKATLSRLIHGMLVRKKYINLHHLEQHEHGTHTHPQAPSNTLLAKVQSKLITNYFHK